MDVIKVTSIWYVKLCKLLGSVWRSEVNTEYLCENLKFEFLQIKLFPKIGQIRKWSNSTPIQNSWQYCLIYSDTCTGCAATVIKLLVRE
jgi:hypothetical protein